MIAIDCKHMCVCTYAQSLRLFETDKRLQLKLKLWGFLFGYHKA